MKRVLATCLAAIAIHGLAADFDYGLSPREVAPGTYVFEGRTEDFSVRNGGNIVNTGFIVTSAGVVVIDTGPSRRYGEQMRAAIRRVTPKPVVRVFNTHQHPDHFLGNQGYADVGIEALPETVQAIGKDGKRLTENMYRLNGDWMRDTEVLAPRALGEAGEVQVGDHRLTLVPRSGHTGGDLAVFDHGTGVLFAGDLVFYNRAATTPHADLAQWQSALDVLETMPYRVLVPGHGPVVQDGRAIAQTRDYLEWLAATLRHAAERGLDMNEVMALPLPERFRDIALADTEYRRSVTHLYPALEQAALGRPR